jgi:hypothetical protein
MGQVPKGSAAERTKQPLTDFSELGLDMMQDMQEEMLFRFSFYNCEIESFAHWATGSYNCGDMTADTTHDLAARECPYGAAVF